MREQGLLSYFFLGFYAPDTEESTQAPHAIAYLHNLEIWFQLWILDCLHDMVQNYFLKKACARARRSTEMSFNTMECLANFIFKASEFSIFIKTLFSELN